MTTTPTHKSECAAPDCTDVRTGLKDYCRTHQARLDRNGTIEKQKTGPKGTSTATCSRCDMAFKATPRQRDKAAGGRPVYCSRDCQKGDNLVTLECATCQEPVTRRKATHSNGERAFCSPECRNVSIMKPRTGRYITCEAPGCESRVWVKLSEEGKKRYCSAPCRNRSQERQVEAVCTLDTCGKTYSRSASQIGAYCSRACYIEDLSNLGEGWIDADGYRRLSRGANASSVYEHRVFIEELIGRPLLPNENVHHRNGNRSDNRTDGPPRLMPDGKFRTGNLELWSTAQPAGQEIGPKLDWAREMLALYGTLSERIQYADHSPINERIEA